MRVNLEKNSRIAELLETYGSLLSEKQRLYLVSYYNYDLSLSEIAEEFKVSRAAVLDSIQKGINKLEEFEELLNLNKKNKVIEEILNSNLSKEEILKKLERIL